MNEQTSSYQLTQEQERIVHHPLGQHARVLAVAGSGKTTTMVHRVRHLVMDLNQDPKRIRVVMFNRLARESFERKLAKEIFEVGKRPKVLTFHSLAFRMRTDVEKRGLLPHGVELWVGDKEELALICMHRAIDSLLREGAIEDDVDPREALDAVSLWKASLIPPERAGHRHHPDLSLVYRRFEEFREQKRALTFDDFVPKALELIKNNPELRRRWTNQLDHLIVDEYQDINYGQQKLIQLIAGDRADVMVVGDDDQTIYEWRAARPYYILQGFKEDFSNKPVVDYKLSHSFRFGPLVAQLAYNTITFNRQREPKPLVSHQPQQMTGITILTDESEQSTQIALSMGQEVVTLVRHQQVPPEKIAVLGRTFVQMEGLQTVFIQHKIPFRVLGMGPFFERDENRTLVDYVRLALAWDQPARAMRPWRSPGGVADEEESAQSRVPGRYRTLASSQHSPYGEAVRTVLAVANTPSRRLSRIALQQAVERAGRQGLSLGASLEGLLDEGESPLPADRREALQELIGFLRRIAERVTHEPDLKAGELFSWIVEHTGYQEHFARYYGEGTASIERMASVDNFITFATTTQMTVLDFIEYLRTLDPTQGQPPDKVITMTTVHRTKGLEYDYVFIPACVEGHMPVHMVDDVGVYDTAGIVPDHPLSPALESERRLFYVAITRAVKHLYIGTIVPPPAGQQTQSSTPLPSRFLDEIQLEPTWAIIKAFQKTLTSGDGRAGGSSPGDLDQVLTRFAGYHSLLRYVADNYLTVLGQTGTIERVNQLLAEVPEIPFEYRYSYPGLGARIKSLHGMYESVTEPDIIWEIDITI
ncbi:MAG: DNA helicase Rep [Anaerolineae bacterium]